MVVQNTDKEPRFLFTMAKVVQLQQCVPFPPTRFPRKFSAPTEFTFCSTLIGQNKPILVMKKDFRCSGTTLNNFSNVVMSNASSTLAKVHRPCDRSSFWEERSMGPLYCFLIL
jgi:hypothetical protein